ncbi:MAG: fibrobacter succinogenes major paralogous domain-containing protein [Snowella sp.]|nr:fibrobacter succinogenes major paralogous domain-containing protein [Snowella sp.]
MAAALSTLFTTLIYGQVGIGTNSPVASAKLEISSTTQGFLPPRMTTAQRDQISSPAIGLIIFNTTTDILEMRTSSGWLSLKVVSSSQEIASIKIGNQIWMLENLNVSTFRDGSSITQVTDQAAWDNLSTGAMCDYLNDPTYTDIYGKLYNYYAIVDSRGLCPSGWHVPSDAEYTTLTSFLGGNAGGKMKSSGFKTPNKGATNSSGFTALPGGNRIWGGAGFGSESSVGSWWTSTEATSTTAYVRELGDGFGDCLRSIKNKKMGASVRCIKD